MNLHAHPHTHTCTQTYLCFCITCEPGKFTYNLFSYFTYDNFYINNSNRVETAYCSVIRSIRRCLLPYKRYNVMSELSCNLLSSEFNLYHLICLGEWKRRIQGYFPCFYYIYYHFLNIFTTFTCLYFSSPFLHYHRLLPFTFCTVIYLWLSSNLFLFSIHRRLNDSFFEPFWTLNRGILWRFLL